MDCKDGTDELSCTETTVCVANEYFTCDNGKKHCMSKACDGVNDCQDQRDETMFCGILECYSDEDFNIKDLSVRTKAGGKVSFVFESGYESEEKDIKIYSLSKGAYVATETSSDDEVVIGDHSNCERYAVIVKQEDRIIKYRHYTYAPREGFDSPTRVIFDADSNTLKWRATSLPCFAPTFYIECLDTNGAKSKTFSTHNFLNLSPQLPASCQVASCPNAVFGPSCSPFSAKVVFSEANKEKSS
ncbi:Basement membrane-specific heparan sulfate proteoglycan core protein [Thelohanellus kitauei]|uniref:Basement membrane-specific heparan sulfate proteoglycan core protein n=1 Tax=Thelohanellus kitauei TaxID=669202 RepID=A0A0C2J469_THEKT|nr:Basement membrane-specific heparan sulfate proteoglycan core protein [Thelohanellus kitauei]